MPEKFKLKNVMMWKTFETFFYYSFRLWSLFKGSGTRTGTGKCKCDDGYTGDLCDGCEEGYYQNENSDCSSKHNQPFWLFFLSNAHSIFKLLVETLIRIEKDIALLSDVVIEVVSSLWTWYISI